MKIKLNPIARAIAVFGATAALVTGVTFAALSSSATLTESTINSATASLKVWDGASFESTAPGFTVTNLVPGTQTQEYPFYLQNESLPLNVTVQSSTPVSAEGFDNFADVKVRITSNEPGCGSNVVETDLGALIAGPIALPCNALAANSQGNDAVPATEGNFSMSFNIPAEEVSGGSASVGAFTFTLVGTQV